MILFYNCRRVVVQCIIIMLAFMVNRCVCFTSRAVDARQFDWVLIVAGLFVIFMFHEFFRCCVQFCLPCVLPPKHTSHCIANTASKDGAISRFLKMIFVQTFGCSFSYVSLQNIVFFADYCYVIIVISVVDFL